MLFISYTRADRDGIGTLLTDLRALGHAVWMDEELSGGEVWWNEIVAKIRQCDAPCTSSKPICGRCRRRSNPTRS